MNEYETAVRVLTGITESGRSLDNCIAASDSALSKQICYGVLREYYLLDALLDQLLDKPLPSKHADLQMLLMAGIYSARHLKRPVHASVNAAVSATPKIGKAWARKLVNGVLRNYLRRKDALLATVQSNPEAQSNHPAWLEREITRAYPDAVAEILKANQQQAPMTLRVNLSKISRTTLLARLAEANVSATEGRYAETAIYLSAPMPVLNLPGFEEGLVSVQDEASQVAASLLTPAQGERVLDACAAPGGKTCAILERCPGIELVALDKEEHRLIHLHENLTRLGLNCQVLAQDLLDHNPGFIYQHILLDAPCSATGIIRRHPDIKLLRRESDIAKLATTQAALLEKAWSLLAPGGQLVYSTCSILPAENDNLVGRFVDQTEGVEVMQLNTATGRTTQYGRQLLPEINGVDGFYFARLKKAGS